MRNKLLVYLQQFRSAAVALSGGADSALLCRLAADALGAENVIALTASGSMIPPEEIDAAAALCRQLNIRHTILPAEEFSVEAFRFNRKDRCYHCKKNIFRNFQQYAADCDIHVLLDGTNADDLKEDRPGLQAAQELGVIKPLADCNITKQAVYALLKEYGMTAYIKPSMSCLATRFPTDTELTSRNMERCWALEKAIRRLGIQGYLRARISGEYVKIEAREDCEKLAALRTAIENEANKLGFYIMEEHR